LYDYLQRIQSVAKLKKYLLLGHSVYNQCWQKLEDLQNCSLQDEAFVAVASRISKPLVHVKKDKVEKGSSPKESLAYFVSGKTIDEVAKIRNLAVSTIEKHLSDFVKTGELEIGRFLSQEQVDAIRQAYLLRPGQTTKDLKEVFHERFSYSELRMALNQLIYKKEI
jgi:uncharacterized protein YpbB